jgi:hypothetical protein
MPPIKPRTIGQHFSYERTEHALSSYSTAMAAGAVLSGLVISVASGQIRPGLLSHAADHLHHGKARSSRHPDAGGHVAGRNLLLIIIFSGYENFVSR